MHASSYHVVFVVIPRILLKAGLWMIATGLLILTILSVCSHAADGKIENEIRGFKNAVVVEEWTNGPLIVAKEVVFDERGILVDPAESETSYTSFPWTEKPRIFVTNSDGYPTEVVVDEKHGIVYAGNIILPMPCRIK